MSQVSERISRLRELMKKNGMDAYLVVTDDFHASEYVSPYFECRTFLTGFDGSAGTVIITQEDAALWTDGRYFLQAEEQLRGSGIKLMKMGQKDVPALDEYLASELGDGQVLGFDGRTVSTLLCRRIRDRVRPSVKFAMDRDLVGEIWEDRPDRIHNRIFELELKYAGTSRAEKFSDLRQKLDRSGADCLVLSSLDDIAWLLNLRGSDVSYNPVFLSYMIIKKDESLLYIDPSACSDPLKAKLKEEKILLKKYDSFFSELPNEIRGQTVFYDPKKSSALISEALSSAKDKKEGPNPTEMPKAVKNDTELDNIRLAHKKDAVAMIRFFHWLEEAVGKEPVTEISAAEKLEAFRSEGDNYYGQSFAPIAGFKDHGAIIHYEASPDTDAALSPESFLLLDTGGQYLEGTTDITRTIPLGELKKDQKILYTLVLKGNLDLADVRFPAGTTGLQLDCLARMALWENGYDFNHGTGHGVGYFLNVHEGPQSIRNRLPEKKSDCPELLPGMVLSDEPGIYLPGEYGIRLENLMVVVPDQETGFGEFLKFETLTLVPFDLSAIEMSMLTEREKIILKEYHERILREIGPELSPEDLEWLKKKLDEKEVQK